MKGIVFREIFLKKTNQEKNLQNLANGRYILKPYWGMSVMEAF